VKLQEALETGRAFKRATWEDYITVTEDRLLTVADALAEDYLVEPEAIELTAEGFAAAWDRARLAYPSIKAAGTSAFYQELFDELFTQG
jgi:hypothetical protein